MAATRREFLKVAGATLGKVFLRMGYEMFDYTEYPSLIRGGHNCFEITVGQKVHHHMRPVQLLIALNQETVDFHMSELAENAGIIFDPLNLLAPQTVSFQRLIENLRRDKEIGLPQLRDGIGKFYQLFFSSQFEQADGANNDRQTQLARRFASIPVVH